MNMTKVDKLSIPCRNFTVRLTKGGLTWGIFEKGKSFPLYVEATLDDALAGAKKLQARRDAGLNYY